MDKSSTGLLKQVFAHIPNFLTQKIFEGSISIFVLLCPPVPCSLEHVGDRLFQCIFLPLLSLHFLFQAMEFGWCLCFGAFPPRILLVWVALLGNNGCVSSCFGHFWQTKMIHRLFSANNCVNAPVENGRS